MINIISILALLVISYGVLFSYWRLVLTLREREKQIQHDGSSEIPCVNDQATPKKYDLILYSIVLSFSILFAYYLFTFLSSASKKNINTNSKMAGVILNDTNKIALPLNEIDSLQKMKDQLNEYLRTLRLKTLFHGEEIIRGKSIKVREGQSLRERLKPGSPYKLFYLIDISVYKINQGSALFLIKDSIYKKTDTLNIRLSESAIKKDSNYVLTIKLNKIDIKGKSIIFEPKISGLY